MRQAHLLITPVIHPSKSHPSVILFAIASRDLARAEKVQKQYGFTKAHASYAALVDDPEVDIVYVSVPNALHYEWASKALRAGKHVLCEKPFTSNADEAKRLVQLGKEKGLVIEEAVRSTIYPSTYMDGCLLMRPMDDSFTGSSTLPRMPFARSWIPGSMDGLFARMRL